MDEVAGEGKDFPDYARDKLTNVLVWAGKRKLEKGFIFPGGGKIKRKNLNR
jgi:hypothetical protein